MGSSLPPELPAGLQAARPAGATEMQAEMTPSPVGGTEGVAGMRASSQGSVSRDDSETILHNKSPITCGGAENLLPSSGF